MSHISRGLLKIPALQKEVALAKACQARDLKKLEECESENGRLRIELHQQKAIAEGKIATFEAKANADLAALRDELDTVHVEIELNGWNARPIADEKTPYVEFSVTAPVKLGGYEWWMKAEKYKGGRVGLYLCRSEPTHPATHPSGRAWTDEELRQMGTEVDYLLMARQRGSDTGVCATTWQRANFRQGRCAWGFSLFSTLEILERERAYNRAEDRLTLKALVIPRRNLNGCWGRTRIAAPPALPPAP
jgi:hypothetical protein